MAGSPRKYPDDSPRKYIESMEKFHHQSILDQKLSILRADYEKIHNIESTLLQLIGNNDGFFDNPVWHNYRQWNAENAPTDYEALAIHTHVGWMLVAQIKAELSTYMVSKTGSPRTN